MCNILTARTLIDIYYNIPYLIYTCNSSRPALSSLYRVSMLYVHCESLYHQWMLCTSLH